MRFLKFLAAIKTNPVTNRLLSFLLSFLITVVAFFLLAASNVVRIDLNSLNRNPTHFYKIFKPKLIEKKILKKKPKKQKQQLAKKIKKTEPSDLRPSQNMQKQEVVEMTELEEDVVIIEKVIPRYPEVARQAGLECQILLEVVVDEKGNAASAKVVHCSRVGYGFEKNAVKAVKRLKFKPIQIDGKAVKVKIIYPIDFVLVE
jgi:TonB family protein